MLIVEPGVLENVSVFLLHSQLSAIPVYLCHRWGLSPHSCPLLPVVDGYYLLLGARLVLLLFLSHRPQNFAWLWEWNFAVPAQWLKAFVSFEEGSGKLGGILCLTPSSSWSLSSCLYLLWGASHNFPILPPVFLVSTQWRPSNRVC